MIAGRLLVIVLFVACLLGPRPACAIPVFAHRYGLVCQTCHTEVPHLTAFGEAFLAAGYRIPGRSGGPVFPVAIKANLQYGSEAEGGLPKAVVDEVELLTGGSVGARGSYFAEQYVVDGGLPGRRRDLWAAWRMGPLGGDDPVVLRAGQFTLDLPIDPETFRETTDHYAIWDQTAGDNPFTFFTPKTGVALSSTLGPSSATGGTLTATVAALQGHDVASGLPAHGLDRYLTLQHTGRTLTLSAYRLDGARALPAGDDRFWREGYGAGYAFGRVHLDAVYQRGFDTRADAGGALRTSGGFLQVRYAAPNTRWFAIARYDGTQDTAFARRLIAGGGLRFSRNTRFTAFDTLRSDALHARRHTLSSALLIAF